MKLSHLADATVAPAGKSQMAKGQMANEREPGPFRPAPPRKRPSGVIMPLRGVFTHGVAWGFAPALAMGFGWDGPLGLKRAVAMISERSKSAGLRQLISCRRDEDTEAG